MTKVHIALAIDRSGSMTGKEVDAEGGLAAFLEQQEPAGTTVSLYEFDNEYTPVYEAEALADVPPYTLVPRGTTALLDAIGRTIVATKTMVKAMEEDERPEKVILLILTDGHENASKKYTLPGVRKLIEKRRAKGWEVLFLGCSEDAIDVGRSMGVSYNTVAVYDDDRITDAMRTAGGMVSRGTTSGIYAYTDEERTGVAPTAAPEGP